MIRVHIFCEGQTEETFINELLYNYFIQGGIFINPLQIPTNKHVKGGISCYGKIKWHVEKKCKEDKTSWVTTMFDFYAFPYKDISGLNIKLGMSSIEKSKAIIEAFQQDIAQSNFFANLIVHEFEGLLFSSPQTFNCWFDEPKIVDDLTKIRDKFESPEHINDGNTTAPSKRILKICKDYEKVNHGSLIALDIGLDIIRTECLIFNQWIKHIEGLSNVNIT
jgi:hypothetical protein